MGLFNLVFVVERHWKREIIWIEGEIVKALNGMPYQWSQFLGVIVKEVKVVNVEDFWHISPTNRQYYKWFENGVREIINIFY